MQKNLVWQKLFKSCLRILNDRTERHIFESRLLCRTENALTGPQYTISLYNLTNFLLLIICFKLVMILMKFYDLFSFMQ